ncbi:MAG: hypothetical protein NVS9B3_06060 [Gemmatimonadaceae bacterium]
MKLSAILPLAATTMLHAPVLPAQSGEGEIRALENAWAAASLKGDTASFNRLMAPDYRAVLSDGTGETRADRLRAFGSGLVRTTALAYSDQRVRVHGGTAIVTGLATRADTVAGRPRSFQYRYTRIWERRDGRWAVVDFQTTTVKPGEMGGPASSTRRDGPADAVRAGRPSIDAPSAEQELLALTLRNARAHVPYDRAWVDSALAEDYVSINGAGVLGDKAGALGAYSTGAIKLDSSDVSDIRVRAYGTSAVVTGVWHFVGLNQGKARSGHLRFTTVWVRRDGRWKEVSWQGTPIAAAEGNPLATHTGGGGNDAETAAQLERLDAERLQEVQRANVRALDSLLANDWLASSSGARPVTKQQYLAELAAGTRWLGPVIHDDLRTRVYGDAALITGRTTGPYRVDGREMNTSGRFTHVYVRRNGRWVMVGMHNTVIPRSPAGPATEPRTGALPEPTAIERARAEQEIIALERRKAELLTHPDRAFADSTLPADYVSINTRGHLGDKADAIQQYSSGRIRLTSSEVSDLRVRVYGPTAVTTGIWQVTGSTNGTARSGRMRYTRVWVQRSGKWESVSWQATDIAAQRADSSPSAESQR